MRISDCLINLVKTSKGITSYEILYYLSELVKRGYLDIDGDKYIIKENEDE